MLRERQVALKLGGGRWYQGVKSRRSTSSERQEKAGLGGRAIVSNDFRNKICHKGTHALQQNASLLDYLIGAGEQSGRDGEAQHFRSFEVDDQLEFGRLLDGHVGGLRAFENLVNVDGGTAE